MRDIEKVLKYFEEDSRIIWGIQYNPLAGGWTVWLGGNLESWRAAYDHEMTVLQKCDSAGEHPHTNFFTEFVREEEVAAHLATINS